MKHLKMCYYLHIPLVDLNVKNKTTCKALVEDSLQMGEGKERMKAGRRQ